MSTEVKSKKPRSPAQYSLFGEMLEAERLKRDLTLDAVGQRIHKPPATIWRRERGQLRVDMIEFVQHAEAVGFDPEEFLREFLTRVRRTRRTS